MRRRLRKTLGCARKLQAAWRGYYVRRKFREEYDRKAQIIIQSRMFESKKVQWYLERERQVMRGKIAVFREWAFREWAYSARRLVQLALDGQYELCVGNAPACHGGEGGEGH